MGRIERRTTLRWLGVTLFAIGVAGCSNAPPKPDVVAELNKLASSETSKLRAMLQAELEVVRAVVEG